MRAKPALPAAGEYLHSHASKPEVFHAQAPDWQLSKEVNRIERSFRFRNFREALTFVQEIGELAEAEGHHPNISFGWGDATVSLQTKKIKGLHENDFIMATKIDRMPGPPRRERVLKPAATCGVFSVPSALAD